MDLIASGRLAKMRVTHKVPVHYALEFEEGSIDLSDLLGKPIRVLSKGEIRCSYCQRKTNKSFNQGFCYPCFQKLARCDRCIMSPELCHYQAGTCREPEWGEQHCMQPHIVYLANSSGLKVGITRQTQIPTRWIDQGAVAALPIISVSSRHLSGLVEVIMKQWVADKTNWRKMLKHELDDIDLLDERERLFELAASEIEELQRNHPQERIDLLSEEPVQHFDYPALSWPEKIKTFNLDKTPEIEGQLMAIKGQYLIFDSGCLNVRKFTSYEVEIYA